MQVNIKHTNDVMVVKMVGELDHHYVEDSRKLIDKDIDKKNIKHLVFDLEDVTFMDSSGIGLVIGRYKKINSNNGQVSIVKVQERVDTIFQMAGIYKIIGKFAELEDAISSGKRSV